MLKHWLGYIAVLVVMSCHDAKRDNPLDPTLTPAVELTAVLDSTSGAVMLNWTAYEGQMPFAHYAVQRNIVDRVQVETLRQIEQVDSIAYVDTTLAANTAYEYRVEVVNEAGLVVSSPVQRIDGFAAGGVVLRNPSIDVATAQVRLLWSRYSGSRFGSYRVLRRTGEEAEFGLLEVVEEVGDTTYSDPGVEPGRLYFYRIDVTAAGQPWPGESSTALSFELPSIALGADVDPVSTSATLTWTRYAGPDFGGYQVLRLLAGEQEFVEVESISSLDDTTFVDVDMDLGQTYLYQIAVQVAGQSVLSNLVQQRINVTPVQLLSLVFDPLATSRSGQDAAERAVLNWAAYSGPRFAAYQVMRRAGEGAFQPVGDEFTGLDEISYNESGLDGNTTYCYRVDVRTDRGQILMGEEEQCGGFHFFVDEWPLPLDEDDVVRLYTFAEDRLTAVVANEKRVRLLTFANDGALLDELDLLPIIVGGTGLEPRSVTVDWSEEGQGLLSLVTNSFFNIVSFDEGGLLFEEPRELFADVDLEAEFAEAGFDASNPAHQSVGGMITLKGGRIFNGNNRNDDNDNAVFDNVAVTSGGVVLHAEDFTTMPPDWSLDGAKPGRIEQGVLTLFSSDNFTNNKSSKEDSTWHNFRLDVDVSMGGRSEIIIGSPEQNVSFSLILDVDEQFSSMRWRFAPPDGNSSSIRSPRVEEDLHLVSGIPYRVSIEAIDGRVRAWIRLSRVVWSESAREDANWAAMARLGDQLMFSLEEQGRTLDLEALDLIDEEENLHAAEISELRLGIEKFGRVAGLFCLPREHQVHIVRGLAQSAIRNMWSSIGDRTQLSNSVGRDKGSFLFPISSAFGPDGQVYVLDAGNDRIQVFSVNNQYLTQWGGSGSQAGEFNFKRQSTFQPEDYVGSITVDAEGFIYVADVMNGRIQKFSP